MAESRAEGFDLSGLVAISGHLYEYVDTLQEKVFIDSDKKTVHQFALAVGITAERRLKKSEHKAQGDIVESNPGSQLPTHENIEAIVTLLSLQGSLGESKPNDVITEYINGGLQFLREISFENQDEDSQASFLAKFPFLI